MIDLPEGDFDAYLFDCDGTLIHSMPWHYAAWQYALKQSNAPFRMEVAQYEPMAGVATTEVVAHLNTRHGTQLDPQQVADAKSNFYLRHVDEIDAIEDVVSLARAYKKTCPIAVVTGGRRAVVTQSMKAAGLEDLLEPLVTFEDVAHGKPHPDIFLYAAKLLGVSPKRCLVFEDGDAGIAGAEAAGMAVARVHSQLSNTGFNAKLQALISDYSMPV